MSDGPHKSLKMRRGWKRLAERADNVAFAPEDVRSLLPQALRKDWLDEVPSRLVNEVRRILIGEQDFLFGDLRCEQLEAMRNLSAGYPLSGVLLDRVLGAINGGLEGDQALKAATVETLNDRAMRGARQVEEHYRRKSDDERAANVRDRIAMGIAALDMGTVADAVLGTGASDGLRVPAKRVGLDDGVQL